MSFIPQAVSATASTAKTVKPATAPKDVKTPVKADKATVTAPKETKPTAPAKTDSKKNEVVKPEANDTFVITEKHQQAMDLHARVLAKGQKAQEAVVEFAIELKKMHDSKHTNT